MLIYIDIGIYMHAYVCIEIMRFRDIFKKNVYFGMLFFVSNNRTVCDY